MKGPDQSRLAHIIHRQRADALRGDAEGEQGIVGSGFGFGGSFGFGGIKPDTLYIRNDAKYQLLFSQRQMGIEVPGALKNRGDNQLDQLSRRATPELAYRDGIIAATFRDDLMEMSLRRLFGVFTHKPALSTTLHDRGDRHQIRAASLVVRLREFESLLCSRSLEDTARLMNDYYSSVAEVVLSTDGDVDSFSGATIASLYYEHRFKSSRSLAIALGLRLEPVIGSLQERYKVGIGVGLCTGELLYGPYGSSSRLSITGFGEPIACASHLADEETCFNVCNRVGMAAEDLAASAHSSVRVVPHWHPPKAT